MNSQDLHALAATTYCSPAIDLHVCWLADWCCLPIFMSDASSRYTNSRVFGLYSNMNSRLFSFLLILVITILIIILLCDFYIVGKFDTYSLCRCRVITCLYTTAFEFYFILYPGCGYFHHNSIYISFCADHM